MPKSTQSKQSAKKKSVPVKKLKIVSHTDDGTSIVNVTMAQIRKGPPTAERQLVRIPQVAERSKCYSETAEVIGEREALALPYHGGRMWKCEVKLSDFSGAYGDNCGNKKTDKSNSKSNTDSAPKKGHKLYTPLFRWYRGKLELATLPHILQEIVEVDAKLPSKKKWAHGMSDDELDSSDEEWDEDDRYVVEPVKKMLMDVSALTTSAYEDSLHPLPIITRSWISPDLQRFSSRKSAIAHAEALIERDCLIDRTLFGYGKNGIRLRPVKPTKKAALEAGIARFLRDGLWVVGQEEMWIEKRREMYNNKLIKRMKSEEIVRVENTEKDIEESCDRSQIQSACTSRNADVTHLNATVSPENEQTINNSHNGLDEIDASSDKRCDCMPEINIYQCTTHYPNTEKTLSNNHMRIGGQVGSSDEEVTRDEEGTRDEEVFLVEINTPVIEQKCESDVMNSTIIGPIVETESIVVGECGCVTIQKNIFVNESPLKGVDCFKQNSTTFQSNEKTSEFINVTNSDDKYHFKDSHEGSNLKTEREQGYDSAAFNDGNQSFPNDNIQSNRILSHAHLNDSKYFLSSTSTNHGLDLMDVANIEQNESLERERVSNNCTMAISGEMHPKTISPNESDASLNEVIQKRPKCRRSYIEPLPPSTHYRLNAKQIEKCFTACIDHYEKVMHTVKARSLHRELSDGFDVLRERGTGRYDMELTTFDTDEFSFLTDVKKAAWMPIVHKILGEDAILVHKGCFLSLPGSETQVYHQDGIHLNKKFQKPCHAVNVFIPLIDLDRANGPTEFCLGSHYLGHENFQKEMIYTPHVLAGTPIIFDYRLGHRGLKNCSKICRPLVYLTYSSLASGKEFRDSVNFSRKRYRKLGDFVEKPLSREERAKKRKAEMI